MTKDKTPLCDGPFDRQIDVRILASILLFVCVFAVFMNAGFGMYVGPIMAALMVYLYLYGSSELVTALVIVANDALGTILLGKLSFQYLLLALLIIGFIKKRSVSRAELAFFVVSFVLQVELALSGFLNFRSVLFSMIYILAIIALPKEEHSLEKFWRGIAITVGLIALHACLTGGVRFTEYEDKMLVVRRGILGTGIGDPNYSGFLLNIGLVCTWCDKKMKRVWKLLLSASMFGAMLLTVSVSGFLSVVIVTVLFFLLEEKRGKGVTVLLTVCVVVPLLLGIYISAPEELHFAGLDNYIERITEKLTAFGQGDMAAVTTERSTLLSDYLAYIMTQPVVRLLFGGNSLDLIRKSVPHNTYVGLILQVGVLGTCLIGVWGLGRVKNSLGLPRSDSSRRRSLLLKALALFMATNLSLYGYSLWAFWMFFLILL